MKIFRLDGKVAIVTGGSGLFGKPISSALAEAGAKVIIASRNESNCRDQAKRIRARGFEAEGYFLDQGKEESICQFIEKVLDIHGTIDVLVNNAVSRAGMDDLEKLNWEKTKEGQQINTTGLFFLTKEVIHVMKQNQSGSIINVSSIQGSVGPNFTVYGNTGMSSPVNYTYDKWGIVGFTKWLANYYGRFNIRANCISPGGYGPGIDKKGKDEFIENYKRLTPLRRFADDEDIKGPVIFLASEASSYITGHNLLVDGGWTSW